MLRFMSRQFMTRLVLLGAVSIFSLTLAAVELTVTPDRVDGVYQPGQMVTWTITVTEVPAEALGYTVKAGGVQDVAAGKLMFADGKATVSASWSEPGTLLLAVAHDKKTSYGGAAYAWDKIPVSAPEPADFDAFWQGKIAELQAVPMDAKLEAVESGEANVDLWKITMGNIRGSKIQGYFARPKGNAPCPAMLAVQWAGVYPLQKQWSVNPAKSGWMVLNLIAHDLPIDEGKAFYDAQNAGALKGYPTIGNDDRESSYFLRMYLSCYRGADYLIQRSDWNKTTLLSQGGSQGGLQAIMVAGLHPGVTAVTANVPAGCDHTGEQVKRMPGWPHWVQSWSGKDVAKMTTASTYYDVVNFARRIKGPVLVGMGLIDTTCAPAGVFAMFNQIPGPKRVIIMPTADHSRPHDAYYPVMGAWWGAAKDGKAVPLK